MDNSWRFLLVDDDPDIRDLVRAALEEAGHRVEIAASGLEALERVSQAPFDCVLLDLMMPTMDGLELCRRLRADPLLEGLFLISLSGVTYDTDRQQVQEAGADGFIAKTHDPRDIVRQALVLLEGKLSVCFWGSRGTMPVPGPDTIRYGGETCCVSLTLPDGHVVIFDAGSGIRSLGAELLSSGSKLTGTVLISHPHWDHLNFLPFFGPLYVPGNQFELAGPSGPGIPFEQLVARQMDGVHFPITPREFGARVVYQDLSESTYNFGGAEVDTLALCHPGRCLGYRLRFRGRCIAYVTDNELFPPENEGHSPNYLRGLVEFVRSCDLLITDATYLDEDYPDKMGWGHSSVSAATELAHAAGVKALYLFHHDPEQNDRAIDAKVEQARRTLQRLNSTTTCQAALARQRVELTSRPERLKVTSD